MHAITKTVPLASIGMMLLALGVSMAPGCSLLVDASAAQCETTADCVGKGPTFAHATCGANKTCTTGGTVACQTNADCKYLVEADGVTKNAICTPKSRHCAQVEMDGCSLIGRVDGDSTVIFGALSSHLTTDDEETAGPGRVRAITLGLSEINSIIRDAAITVSGSVRQFAVLACDDVDPVARIAAANHLANELEVPAIIGANESVNTLDVANRVTLAAQTLLLVPTASSDLLGTSQLNAAPALLWRMAAPDSAASRLIADQVVALKKLILAETPQRVGIRIAIVYPTSIDGAGLAKNIQAEPAFIGRAGADSDSVALFPYDAVDSLTQGGRNNVLMPITNRLTLEKPDIILLLGNAESPYGVIQQIHETSSLWAPYFILTHGAQLKAAAEVASGDAQFAAHIRGVVSGVDQAPTAMTAFRAAYGQEFSSAASEVSRWDVKAFYDATYMLALASFGTSQGPLTGAALAKALPLMQVPFSTPIVLGKDSLKDALSKMRSDVVFHLIGTSGPLTMDPVTGLGSPDMIVWCLGKDPAGQIGFVASGTWLDNSKSPPVITGAYTPTRCQF